MPGKSSKDLVTRFGDIGMVFKKKELGQVVKAKMGSLDFID